MSIESTGPGRDEAPRGGKLGRSHKPLDIKPLAVPVKVACHVLGVGNTTLYDLIKKGRVTTTTIGRRRLVIYSSLEALLQGEAA